ncbi:MAG: Uma2 family endonuclease [Bacteroidota bacterium]
MGEPSIANASYDTYLALEAESELKYEYYAGFIVAMAGGTPAHSQLGANAIRCIGNALDIADKPCRVYNSDLKIRIEAVDCTYYPDATVACEEPEYSPKDPLALVNPRLIVEVLSDSNEKFDRGTKFHHYRRLPSLQEYLLIHQNEVMVDVFYRQEADLWQTQLVGGLDGVLPLRSLGCEIKLSDLYRLVPGLGNS